MGKFNIQFHEMPNDRPIRSFVKEKLHSWIGERMGQLKQPDVKIDFFKAPFESKIGCYIEVKKGERAWRSFEYGRGLHNTFNACLKQLSETSFTERSA